MKTLVVSVLIFVINLFLAGCTSHREISGFKTTKKECFDRNTEPYTSVVDTHLHFRPFGGPAIPFKEITEYLDNSGVRFVNVYGIGQSLPINSSCTYYLDCPGTPALPSIKNDFINAANYLREKPQGVHMTLAMTFPDLAKPENVAQQIKLFDTEYPGLFKWVGEVNLVKQALFNNHHSATPLESIGKWSEFMTILKERGIPIAIHSDLGNDKNPTQYLHLMAEVLNLYPDNKIVWVHMGLSKELKSVDPDQHISILKSFLDRNRNLMLDISWRVINDNYFTQNDMRAKYVAFFNEYSDRILPGTDFVASRKKTYDIYEEELEVNSRINKYLDDKAFRNIALGQNYFRLLNLDYEAPQICSEPS